MLSPYLLCWAPLTTISYLYLDLSLQSLLRIPQSADVYRFGIPNYPPMASTLHSTLISSFLSGPSIPAVVDNRLLLNLLTVMFLRVLSCSPVTHFVPIIHQWFKPNFLCYPLLHWWYHPALFASFHRRPTLQEVNRSHREATEHLTSDL